MISNISSNMIILPENVHLSEEGRPPRRKHILLVPDYFTSAESVANEELRKRLQLFCGDTAVFYAEDEIDKAREEVEKACIDLRIDLLVTIGSGCLLAAGISNLPRIFIDPNWLAGKALGYDLGEDENRFESRAMPGDTISIPMHYDYKVNAGEVDAVLRMAVPDNIKKGDRLALGWFTEKGRITCNSDEHIKRFGTAYYPEGIELDSEEGLDKLCQEINNLLSSL